MAYDAATVSSVAASASGELFFNVRNDGDPLNRAWFVKIARGNSSKAAGRGNGTGNSGNNGPAVGTYFTNPRGIALDSAGSPYVADVEPNESVASSLRKLLLPGRHRPASQF